MKLLYEIEYGNRALFHVVYTFVSAIKCLREKFDE